MPCRVLIVDDEPFIREMLCSFLVGNDAEYLVEGEMINGLAALDFMAKNLVDIVITDIRMPVMDGIALLREARIRGYSAKFIMLSAYDDFHLVKEAFKLGAGDYLLKSEITREEMLESLQRMSTDRERRSRIFGRILEEGMEMTEGETRELGLSGESGTIEYRVIFIRHFGPIRNSEPVPQSANGKGAHPLRGWIQRSLEDLGETETVFTEWGETGAAILLVGCQKERLFDRISGYTAEDGFELAGGISTSSSNPSEIRELFLQAIHRSSLYFFHGRGRLSSNILTSSGNSLTSREISARSEELRKLVALRNADHLSERIQYFTVHIAWPSIDAIATIRNLFGTYHDILASAIVEDPDDSYSYVKAILEDFDQRIRGLGTLDECNAWIRNVLEAYCRILASRSRLVRKVLEVVGSDFAKDIHLSQIARHMEVSESYLSRMFSREMNCGFVAYLARVRIENALRLLRTTELKIYEIAEKTGYPNVEHFSRTFKKILGRSPKEFR